MKIAIHASGGSYSDGWIAYCEREAIAYKLVNAYDTDVINEIGDCDIFMWHHQHARPEDAILAKPLLHSLEQAGKTVYPNHATAWHFDDKLGQKYLLEALKLPLVPTFAFYSEQDALKWASTYRFPAVFKLRGGAGSYNVRLVRNKKEATSLIRRAFGRGFRYFDPAVHIRESLRHFALGKLSAFGLLKSFAYLLVPFPIERAKGRDRGYALFQAFVPNCNSDIRVQVVGQKAYAMRRHVRRGDFRASGSGVIDFDGSKIPSSLIEVSFDVAKKLDAQSLAIDFLPNEDTVLIAEISYAWGIADGELEPGYWDSSLTWHHGRIDPTEWIIEEVIQEFKSKLDGAKSF